MKLDLETGKSTTQTFGGAVPGEAVFVPAEGSDSAGDDGWVITYLHDEKSEKTALAILDASNFEAEPVARIELPRRVPYGFHGSWISDTPR